MASKPRNSATARDVELRKLDVSLAIVLTVRYVLMVAALAVPIWAMAPIARAVAGKQTTLNVSFVLSLTLAVTLAGGGAWAWGLKHKRRADRLALRNEKLTRNVEQLQQRLREKKLPVDVTE